MTRVGSPSPGPIPPALPQGAPVAAVLAELPSGLRNIGLGAFLSGTVVDRASNGLTLLQTGAGVLGIKTTVPLPIGSAVTLQVQTAGAQLQAIVLSVTPQNGATLRLASAAPIPAAPSPAHTAATPAAQPAATAAHAAPQPPADGRTTSASTITATVIGPAGGPVPAAVAGNAQIPPQAATATTAQISEPPRNPQAAPSVIAQPVPAGAQTAAYQRQFNAVPAPQAPSVPGAPAPVPPLSVATVAEPKAPPQPAQAGPPPAPLPSGTQVQVRLLPADAAGPDPLPTPVLAASTPAPAPRTPLAATLGLAGLLRSPEPASPAPASTVPPQAATTLAATIVARTPAGQTILDTLLGRVLAPLPRALETMPPGSKLLLELLASEAAASAVRSGAALSTPSALAREWPALKEMMRLLQQAPTQAAHDTIERIIPKPGPRLAQQIMSFIEQGAQGGARAWLGEAVTGALQRLAATVLVERLDQDVREMLSQRAADGEWRMTVVPMLDGRDFRQIRFFERRKKREEAERRKDDSSRFVVECEHSEFGEVQLDGLMHEKRMDLIVRTHEPLPPDMERDIMVLFGKTCTGLDLNGQLYFQAVPVFPVHPLDEFGAGVTVSA